MPKLRGAILISGRGSNMRALLKAARADDDYPIEFALIIADKKLPEALSAAAELAPRAVCLTIAEPERTVFEAQLLAELQDHHIDLVCLAGFMRVLSSRIVRPFADRIVNIHPSLLPRFKGRDTHRRALEAWQNDHTDAEHGCSVHRVTERLDSGEVLGQAKLTIATDDTADSLEARVLELEHRLYPKIAAKEAYRLLSSARRGLAA